MDKWVKISGRKLSALRRERFYTQQELGDAIGMTGGGVRRIEGEDETGMQVGNFKRLAEWVKIGPDELLKRLSPNGSARPTFLAGEYQMSATADPDALASAGVVPPIPLWDIDVAAGPWVPVTLCGMNYDDPEGRRIIDAGRFRLRILGDSMQPKYPSGCLVEFVVLRAYDAPELGREYAVCRADDCATFKRLESITDDELVLVAINKRKYREKIRVPRQEVTRMALAEFTLTKT